MNFVFRDEYLCIRSNYSFILIGRVLNPFTLFIETSQVEHCQYLETGDLVVVSAPEGGRIGHGIILLELIREYHVPLVVLPKGHPGSKKIPMVVSAGDIIELNCTIQRGTHPEQHLLCSSDAMAGMIIKKTTEGVELTMINETLQVNTIPRKILD